MAHQKGDALRSRLLHANAPEKLPRGFHALPLLDGAVVLPELLLRGPDADVMHHARQLQALQFLSCHPLLLANIAAEAVDLQKVLDPVGLPPLPADHGPDGLLYPIHSSHSS